MTWLAYQYSPEQVVEWLARKPGSRAYYASQFQQVFGTTLERAWAQWLDRFEQPFQQANLDAIRKFPVTPYRDLSHARARLGLARVLRPADEDDLRRVQLSRGRRARRHRSRRRPARRRHLADIKGPLIYQVTSVAMDPAGPTLFYTTDNLSYRDLVALDLKTGKRQVLQKDARIGDLVFDRPTARSGASGI